MRRTGLHINTLLSAILITALCFLPACGGGGGSTAGGGIGGTGVIASGSVTNKGSVYVNGSIYDTDAATTFTLDDSPGTEDEIRRGMVVRVDGTRETVTTGNAISVIYEDVVEGPLTDYSAPPSDIMTLTVLGQTVIVEEGVTYVDDGTVLAPNPLPQTLPDFSTVTALEVSGLRDASSANGVIRATYIEIKTGLSEYEVKGVIEDDPTNTYDFKIAGLGIDYSGAVPPVGTTVEVKGTLFTPPNALVASNIQTRTPGLGETEFDHAEVEGFITNLNTLNETFSLNGQVINYTGAIFESGVVGDLNDGNKVEAEGSISGSILNADKIEFKESIRIEGNAINVDNPVPSALEIEGLEGNGLVIYIDSSLTEIEDVSGNPGTIASISDGYEIKVRGRDSTSGIIATDIEVIRTSRSDKISLQGTATTVSEPSIGILGAVTIDTSNPLFKFFNANDDPLDSTQFYSLLEVDDLVKAKGDLNPGTSLITWKEIELED